MSGYRSKQGLSRPQPQQVKADSMELGAVEMGQNCRNGKGMQACHGNTLGLRRNDYSMF
jgi:hypothetical protein